jgi:phosphoglycerol transferase MdoB-like AlkP superfamily enzyme
METIYAKKTIKEIIINKIKYIASDSLGLAVFSLMIIKTILFMDILNAQGAASLPFSFHTPLLGNKFIYLFFIIAVISFSYLFYKKAHMIVLIIINVLYTILLVGNLWYYRGFNDFLSLHLLGQTQNLNNLSDSVTSMARPIDLIFIIDIMLLVPAAVFLRRRYSKLKKERGIFIFLLLFSVIYIASLHIIYDKRDEDSSGLTFFNMEFVPKSTMTNLSPLGYHFYDSVLFIKDHSPYLLSKEEKDGITDWLDYKNEKLPANEYKGIFEGKNLIFIQVESLENFVINQNYDGQELTPNINKLLKNSLYFNNFYEQVNNGNSSDSDLLSNTSVFPVRRGSTFFRFPNNKYNTLPMLLKEKGYFSRALHSDYGYYWNVLKAISNFGFDEVWDINNFDATEAAAVFGLGLTDKTFFNQVADLTVRDKSPFYYFTVTSSSHGPFDMREDMRALKLSPEFEKTKMGGYFQAVNYADREIGILIENLEKKGQLENTVVVIYGDHTGVHKYYSDEVKGLKEKEAWWDNSSKIPMIIYNKTLHGKTIEVAGGQIDIMPTIAYLMGIDEGRYENTSLGRNLLNTKKSYALLTDGTIIGKENLTEEDIDHINKSFQISDLIIRTNYFKTEK